MNKKTSAATKQLQICTDQRQFPIAGSLVLLVLLVPCSWLIRLKFSDASKSAKSSLKAQIRSYCYSCWQVGKHLKIVQIPAETSSCKHDLAGNTQHDVQQQQQQMPERDRQLWEAGAELVCWTGNARSKLHLLLVAFACSSSSICYIQFILSALFFSCIPCTNGQTRVYLFCAQVCHSMNPPILTYLSVWLSTGFALCNYLSQIPKILNIYSLYNMQKESFIFCFQPFYNIRLGVTSF